LSRLAGKFEEDIFSAKNEEERWAGRLRLAGYWARTGRLDAASQVILEARGALGAGPPARVLALLNLTESLIEFHESRLSTAIDKVRRGIAIGQAGRGLEDVVALGAAWGAHYYRNMGHWKDLTRSVALCLETIPGRGNEASARIALVLADSLLEIGRVKASESWYQFSRSAALDCGDDALIASLIHNRGVLRVYFARLRELTGEPLNVEECLYLMEESSARNYNAYTRNESMLWMLDLLRGQLLTMAGQYEEALEAHAGVDDVFLLPGWPHLKAIREADAAYCLAKLGGDAAEANRHAASAQSAVDVLRDSGDAALVAFRLASALDLLGESEAARRMRGIQSKKCFEYLTYCRTNSELLASCLEPLGSRIRELFGDRISTDELW